MVVTGDCGRARVSEQAAERPMAPPSLEEQLRRRPTAFPISDTHIEMGAGRRNA